MIEINQKAPLFKGKTQQGNTVSLKDFVGQKVVLYFYPEDDTPTCTIQACNLRDNYTALTKKGFVVIGISPNTAESHKKFEQKFNLPFILIEDEQMNIINQYGVWGEKNMYGRKYMGLKRTTFLIDDKGMVKHIFTRPKNKAHAEEIIAVAEKLGL